MTRCLVVLISALAFAAPLGAQPQLRALYGRLDPTSASQHLALYHLYPHSEEGTKALKRAWELLTRTSPTRHRIAGDIPLPPQSVAAIVGLVSARPTEAGDELDDRALVLIENLAAHLPNRQLKGHGVTSVDAVLALDPPEIDVARALFLSQEGAESGDHRRHEAMMDLMALQILARVDLSASPNDKIAAISRFVFDEMNFRFPPHSIYARDIDEYTFLPSVLDGRRGVCLGVSLLYVCLAQRLGLELELVTPPGHIYVRYNGGEINIETTLRGIHVDSEAYLGLETRKLQQRNLREAVGLVHVNAASVYLTQGAPERAVEEYSKGAKFLEGDAHFTELMGYAHVLSGNEEKGKTLLAGVCHHLADESVCRDTMAEDYVSGNVDREGLTVMFTPVDETLESLQEKRRELEAVVKRCPKFRSGWLHLATTWLQMQRTREGILCLEEFHRLHPKDASAEYYLSVVAAERLDYAKAWRHLHNAEALTAARDHHPKALKTLRRELAMRAAI